MPDRPERPDLWATRDLPVLEEVTWRIDQDEDTSPESIADAIGLEYEDVNRSLRALERRGLIEADHMLAGIVGVNTVAGEAYKLTGLHPDGDNAVSQLIDALRQAADQVDDPEEKSRLRTLADGVGGISRDVATNVLTAFLTAAGRGMIG